MTLGHLFHPYFFRSPRWQNLINSLGVCHEGTKYFL